MGAITDFYNSLIWEKKALAHVLPGDVITLTRILNFILSDQPNAKNKYQGRAHRQENFSLSLGQAAA